MPSTSDGNICPQTHQHRSFHPVRFAVEKVNLPAREILQPAYVNAACCLHPGMNRGRRVT